MRPTALTLVRPNVRRTGSHPACDTAVLMACDPCIPVPRLAAITARITVRRLAQIPPCYRLS